MGTETVESRRGSPTVLVRPSQSFVCRHGNPTVSGEVLNLVAFRAG